MKVSSVTLKPLVEKHLHHFGDDYFVVVLPLFVHSRRKLCSYNSTVKVAHFKMYNVGEEQWTTLCIAVW